MRTFSLSNDQPSPQGQPDFLADLNDRQREAVTHTDGPILIIAGAGSGKTRVLTYRIAYLLNQNKAHPKEILALTFTNKAAREMKERIQELIGDAARQLWMGTFHSVFSKILRFEADRIGFDTNFSIYDTDDSEAVIKQILREIGHDPKEVKPRIIRNKISDAKNQLIYPDHYQKRFINSTLDDITAQVYKIYSERLRNLNAMDFDDLLVKPIELFRDHKEVLEKYQERFKYILIDEYQDTNHAQYKVTNMLASKYENLSVVGDDAQSIYSFRGADITNILNFKEDYPHAHEVPLEQNYRSTKSILQCADSIIKRNEKQLEKTLWTENAMGDTITLLENYDERDEANRVANYIQTLRMQEGYEYNDMAILFRTNYQSRVFEEAFRRKGVRYQLVGGLSFYQRKEIKDVLGYLTLLVNPHDEANLLRIINTPSRGIGNKSIHDLLARAREEDQPLWEILKHVDETEIYKPAKNRVGEFVEMIESLKKELGEGKSLSEVTKHVLEKSGYMKALVDENTPKSMARRENVLELQNAIAFYENSNKNPKLSSFLQEISLITDSDKYDEDKPAVTMMTVHASKGLEFPCVFIVGLEENLFPMGGRNGEEADIEEERRLFYVAVTRAEQKLFFSYAANRYKFGKEERKARSRFLDEVDPGVVRTETGATIQQKDQDRFSSSVGTSPHDSSPGYEIEYDWKTSHRSTSQSSSNNGGMHIEYDSPDGDPFQPGVQVEHPKFGPGKILQRIGHDHNSKVVVFFKKHGQKKLMLRVAKLRVME
ncbi:MAG: ATP-dependent helicase [Bacteroidota bacterium]